MVFGFGGSHYNSKPASYASEAPKGSKVGATVSANSIDKAYDYVIVGCGTAGSVLASRLSEDPNVSVCVLEAGGDPSGVLETRIPVAFGKLFDTAHDWAYKTTVQPEVNNRIMPLPRGKMIGGSSSMNAMMHQQIPPSDADEWAAMGCTGWGYKDLKPYIRRTEKFTMNPQRPTIDLTHRGNDGTWQVGYSYLSEVGEHGFINACQEQGIKYAPDINTPAGPLGVTRFQTFIDQKGERSSARTAFLPDEVLARKNLTIGVHAHVTRVLTETSGSEPSAFGVEFQSKKDGPFWRVRANKEVVLSGGAYNSPHLLMLSGIGEAEQLKKHGIPVVCESNEVGKSLYDHLCPSGLYAKAKSPSVTLDYLGSDLKALPSIARWLATGGGPATSNVGETAAFLRSVELASNVKDYGSLGKGPDIEMIFTPLAFRDHGKTRTPAGTGTLSLAATGLRPQSKGTVTLNSADPWEHCVIDHAYLSDPEGNDRKVLIAALRKGLKIMRSDAMKPYVDLSHVSDDPKDFWWPVHSSDPDAITDEQLSDYIPDTAFTLYHPVSTARMGPTKEFPVDLQLRVNGVKNLRVCDASVFPGQIAGHPCSTVIAVAEKLSDIIRGKVAANSDATKSTPVQAGAPVPAHL